MRYRALDENGDYKFGGNSGSYLTDEAAVAQAISTRLKLLLYEWWEDLQDGLPLWQNIIAARDREAAEKIIRERIENTRHVRTILIYKPEWDNENRRLTINAVVDTDYGTLELSEEMS